MYDQNIYYIPLTKLVMNNLTDRPVTDPTGSATLDNISEAESFNKWMYSAISPNLYGKILEIGSGIGNISAFVLKDNSNVTLSDLRPEYCEYLSNHFENNSGFSVELIDLADPDFELKHQKLLNSFDSVFALNVIEHIEDDSLAITNCRKLLKESGNLVILVPAYQWLYCRFDIELGHFRRYNRKTLSALFKKNGLTVKEMYYFNAAGIFGWLLFGKILNTRQIKKEQMRIYNRFVSIFMLIDKIIFRKSGLSIIITGRK
jgi:2-polyprenyl-3-methyl-5-hydroxy-6-metoxy-1,4-benzoquinol methylase